MSNYSDAERHVIEESLEIAQGEQRDWARRVFRVYPALRNKSYRAYFIGQLISFVGNWVQIVAQGWLVFEMTNSAYLIGLVTAISTFPTLIFSLFGGVIVDRFSKRKILIFTHISSMILVFILAFLTVTNFITIWQIMILAFLLGIVQAIDTPARLAFAVEMVGKEDLHSALALNAASYNGARVIGPGIAGFLIALIGVGGAFVVNAFSYIGIVIALYTMHIATIKHTAHPNPFFAIKEGVAYSFRHPVVGVLLLFAGVASIFGWSFPTMLPYMAEHTFHLGAWGLGVLYAASGAGAFCGTVVVSLYSKKIRGISFIFMGVILFALGTVLFSFTSHFYVALVYLYLSGFGLMVMFSVLNITIQTIIEDKYRGRVMSIYAVMFLGLSSFGSFQVGYVSDLMGTGFAIRMGAVVTFACGLLLFVFRKRIRAEYSMYKEKNDIE